MGMRSRSSLYRSTALRFALGQLFRSANRRAVQVFADHYPAEYLGDTVESLVIALRVGCTVSQQPVHMRPRPP